MYIVYFFKKFRILRNFAKYFEILRNIAKYCENIQILNSGLHFFIWPISQYVSKYFEIYFEIFRKKCMPKSFERLRIFRKISRRSQFFRKISVRNFFRKISYIFFADVANSEIAKAGLMFLQNAKKVAKCRKSLGWFSCKVLESKGSVLAKCR